MNIGHALKNSWRNLALTTSAILLGFISYQIINDSKLYREKRQVYDQLRDQAIACVKDLSSNELERLYTKAEIKPNFNPQTGKLELPIIPREKLEEVVANCESESGK